MTQESRVSVHRRDRFPEGFVWGVASASYQIEGSRRADGGGDSVWDAFARSPGAVLGGMNGDLACDSWRRWRDDIELIRGLGVDSYRFSISWARIEPERGAGYNRAAIGWYRRFVEALLEAGIAPFATLYHWDHPNWIEEDGGWPRRDTAGRFADYANFCLRELGDLVGMWATLNEPWCSSILGHDLGLHAPGGRDKAAAYRAVHHLLLAHGLAVRAFRSSMPKTGAMAGTGRSSSPAIGIVLNPSLPRPATRRDEDLLAASRAGDQRTALFMDPLSGRGYPERHLAAFPEIRMPVEAGDLETIASPIDFIGINYYNEDVVEAVPVSPEHPEGFRNSRSWERMSDMEWPVVPGGLARLLRGMQERWRPREFYVTENGYAGRDEPDAAGRVRDGDRIDYLSGHLRACEEAIAEGVPLKGYFQWSLMDNFEWAWGYSKRFGLVHVDFRTMERRPKDSYYWYRDAVAGHGLSS